MTSSLAAIRSRVTRRRLAGTALLAAVLVAATACGTTNSSTAAAGGAPTQATAPQVGQMTPDGTFTTTTGHATSVAALRGTPTLLWFVATWCSSCQAGTQAMAAHLPQLTHAGVRVVELELANDLGQPGPDIATFAHDNAGPAATNPNWTFGTASTGLTLTDDPQGYLDIYYLLDSHGQVRYINAAPASTLPDLLNHATGLS